MEFLIKAGQLLLSLAILVTLHEFGHYITARLFKTRVEKFYLFFNPWFSLFKKKIGETEYGIGWVPLGGYVKIAGMIDESMDKEQLKQAPQPWEFRSKPAWQRLIIMLGGIIVNLILGWFIYSMLLFSIGERYIPAKNASYGIMVDSTAYSLGFRNGDKIISIGGHSVEKLSDVVVDISIDNARQVVVERNDKQETIQITKGDIKKLIANQGGSFISERLPFIIDSIPAEGPSGARDAGIKKGDRIIRIDTNKVFFYDEVKTELVKNKGKEVNVIYVRNEKDTSEVKLKVSESALLGVGIRLPSEIFKQDTLRYNLLQCFPAGFEKAKMSLSKYVKSFKLIFSPEVQGYKYLGGFLSIGKAFSPKWDWISFWSLTAFLSIILAFMNLLPIPALDGGHVMFTLYEMVSGRKPNEKFLEYAQITGMVLLLSLMLYANGNDVMKLFK